MTPKHTTRKPRSRIRTPVPPRRLAWKPPTACVARCSPGARLWESRAELEAGTVHLHANTQNAFPRTRLLLMEALSLEPWKVWNTYFAPSLQLWELPSRTRGACSPGLQVAAARASPAGEPRYLTRARQHPHARRGQSALACRWGPWLERSATRWAAAAGDAPGPRRLYGAPRTRQYPRFPGGCWGARRPPVPVHRPCLYVVASLS